MNTINDHLKRENLPGIHRVPISAKSPWGKGPDFDQMGGTVHSLREDIPFGEAFLEAMSFAMLGVDYPPPGLKEAIEKE